MANPPLIPRVVILSDGKEMGSSNPIPVVVSGGTVSLTLNWAGGTSVSNGTYLFTGTAAYAFDISSLDANIGSAGGSLLVAVRINTVPVGGLSAVSVTAATKTRFLVSGSGFSVASGNTVDALITVSGSPTDTFLTLNGVKT